MTRKLNTYVHVDGVPYGPDDDVPAEVAEKITAPGVWADEEPAEQPGPTSDRPISEPTTNPVGDGRKRQR